MREKALGNAQLVFGISKEAGVNDGYNFHQIKHEAAMKRADELLKSFVETGINDDLNCGKFNAKYLQEMKMIIKSIFG